MRVFTACRAIVDLSVGREVVASVSLARCFHAQASPLLHLILSTPSAYYRDDYHTHIIPQDTRYELPPFRPRRPSQAAQVQPRIESRPLQGPRATGPPLRLAVPGVTAGSASTGALASFTKPPRCEQTTSLDSRSPKDRGLAHCLAVAGRSGRDVLMGATGKRPWFPRDSHACGDAALCLCEPPRAPPRLHICHFTHALTLTTANHASNNLRPLQPLPHAALPWCACTP